MKSHYKEIKQWIYKGITQRIYKGIKQWIYKGIKQWHHKGIKQCIEYDVYSTSGRDICGIIKEYTIYKLPEDGKIEKINDIIQCYNNLEKESIQLVQILSTGSKKDVWLCGRNSWPLIVLICIVKFYPDFIALNVTTIFKGKQYISP